LQFSEVAAATTNMTDLSRHEYDWRLWLSHIKFWLTPTWQNLTGGGDLVTAAPGSKKHPLRLAAACTHTQPFW